MSNRELLSLLTTSLNLWKFACFHYAEYNNKTFELLTESAMKVGLHAGRRRPRPS